MQHHFRKYNMNTINITISNVNVTIDGVSTEVPSSLMSSLLTSMMQSLSQVAEDDGSESESASATANDLLVFLNSDDRFEKRSFNAVMKAMTKKFPGITEDQVGELLNSATSSGVVLYSSGRTGQAYYQAMVSAEAATDAPATDAPKAEVTSSDVLAFLGSDARYTKRTFQAMAEHFGVTGAREAALAEVVQHLMLSNRVKASRRRNDGAALFEKVAGAQVEVETQPQAESSAPILCFSELRNFLTSHASYTQRTLGAIAKYFVLSPADANLVNSIDFWVNEGDLNTTTRRSDGATLYCLA